MQKIKIVELFAGVGGFRLGFENVSKEIFKTIWSNQWEPNRKNQYAFDCYNYHFGNSKNHINEDISIAKFQIPNDIDLLVGGFPCQDYSVARTKAEGIKGKKGVLWWEISWIIKNKKPKTILLENVDRLLKSTKHQKGRDFGIILRDFYNNGYSVEWRVINASEYGFQQRRKRVFIFAYQKEINFFDIKKNNIQNASKLIQNNGFFAKYFPIISDITTEDFKEIDINNKNFKNLIDIQENFKFEFQNSGCMLNSKIFTVKTLPFSNKKPKTLNKILLEAVDEKYNLTEQQKNKFIILKGSKKIERIKPNGEYYYYTEGQMSFPDSNILPARTMLTSEGTVNRSTHVILQKNTDTLRFITPVEAERINGFPDNWTNTGMPERFRYFCMGNALVVNLIELMGKTIYEIWENYNLKQNIFLTKNKKNDLENTINIKYLKQNQKHL